MITALAEAGADVNRANKDGITPLYVAANRGQAKAIIALAEAGADVNRANKDGITPLDRAAWKGHAEAITVLAEAGADVNVARKSGFTPLHWAAGSGHAKAIVALAESGADVNRGDKDGDTPLHVAALEGYAKVIVALAEVGADVNREDKRGETPLHHATWNEHAKAIDALAGAGADVNRAGNNGYTPLHVAAGIGHAQAIDILIKNGAYLNATSDDGETPFDIAQRLKKWSAVAALEKYEEESPISVGGANAVFAKVWRFVVVINAEDVQGSGVIVRPDIVATNCHVVEDADIIGIAKGKASGDKIETNITNLGYIIRRNGDLCLLRAKGIGDSRIKMRRLRNIKIGETVFAIGSPKGLEYTISQGIVSAKRDDDYGSAHIQTDAAISPGSSGGGLFDGDGNLIGITTFSREGGENLNFAISADRILDLLNR